MKQSIIECLSFTLRLKIITGYILLLGTLSIIVSLVWLEKRQMEILNADELVINQKREVINQTFEKLLDFAFSNDFLILKDNNKLDEYRIKRAIATDALNKLKQYYPVDDIQHSRIDNISSLLLKKEKLFVGMSTTLYNFSHTDSLFQQRVPTIISQITQQQALTATTEKRQGGFLSIFKKIEKKSAYAHQREKQKQQLISLKTTGELYSLQKEMHEQYTYYWNKLSAYSDDLHQRNTELNFQINELIYDFEQDTIAQSNKETEKITASREQSFCIILFIATATILLTVVLYIFIYCDISKRQEYRMKLEASDHRNRELLTARRNLILTVSHDLRAPLGTISEYAELLQDEKDAELSKGYALNIRRASRHVMGLANNLLYYYRLEAQKEQPENEIFHLGQTVENAVGTFLPSAEKKGLGLTVGTEGADLLVRGDAGRLVQIINNLLSNAIKFTRTGYIHVGARYGDGKLSLFVRDTGIGIEKERLQQIFTAFERGETSGTGDGYGLGLAITSKLVTLLGGDIRVLSVPEQGSTFTVRLPVGEADGKVKTEEPPSGSGSLFPIRVLAIDDDRLQLDAIKKMYARSSIECDCCLNVGELVEALRHDSYDLVLTDIRMSETDGYGVLSLLRGSNIGQSRTIPVLAVTARTDEREEHFREAGFAGCLYKPFSQKELLTATYGIDRPDFTAILEDERNPDELLRIFVEDTEKELTGMREAFGAKDYEKLGNIVHKAAPLWEVIRIDIPLGELEYIASLPAQKWGGISEKRFERLVSAVEKAVEKAKKILEETHGKHIDRGR